MSRLASALAVVFVCVETASAGVVFDIETKDHQQQPAQIEALRMAVEGRRLTIDIAPNPTNQSGGTMQYWGDRREMVIIDHQSKSYLVMGVQTIEQLGEQLNSAFSQFGGQAQQALQGLPAEQRAMLEKTMKDRLPLQQQNLNPQTMVRRLKQSAQVYGYPCQLYAIRREGRKIRDLWVTDWSNIEGGNELAPLFADMGQFHQELINAMPQVAGQSSEMLDSPFTALKEINGFPVASRDYADDGSVKSETALRSAKRQPVDRSAFQPPTDYRPQQMFTGNGSAIPVQSQRRPTR